jgi:hypothetical protein
MFEIENLSSTHMCVMDELWNGFCFNVVVVVVVVNMFVVLLS